MIEIVPRKFQFQYKFIPFKATKPIEENISSQISPLKII